MIVNRTRIYENRIQIRCDIKVTTSHAVVRIPDVRLVTRLSIGIEVPRRDSAYRTVKCYFNYDTFDVVWRRFYGHR